MLAIVKRDPPCAVGIRSIFGGDLQRKITRLRNAFVQIQGIERPDFLARGKKSRQIAAQNLS